MRAWRKRRGGWRVAGLSEGLHSGTAEGVWRSRSGDEGEGLEDARFGEQVPKKGGILNSLGLVVIVEKGVDLIGALG